MLDPALDVLLPLAAVQHGCFTAAQARDHGGVARGTGSGYTGSMITLQLTDAEAAALRSLIEQAGDDAALAAVAAKLTDAGEAGLGSALDRVAEMEGYD